MSEYEKDPFVVAMAKAQSEMENAVFNKENPHFRSKYADLGAVRAATINALSNNGFMLIQTTDITPDGAAILITELRHECGTSRFSRSLISGTTEQQKGSSRTYNRRYDWSQICGISSEEDDDANAAEREGPKPKAQSRQLFTTLIDLMRDAKTQEELTLVIKENYEMYADLNDDWKRDIKKEGDRLRKLLPQ